MGGEARAEEGKGGAGKRDDARHWRELLLFVIIAIIISIIIIILFFIPPSSPSFAEGG